MDEESLELLPKNVQRKANDATSKLKLACFCSIIFMIAEVIGGFYAGSLAIMTDAAHLLSDVASFLISIFAIYISTLPPSSKMSYGFPRAEVLGTIVSVLLIWTLTGCLVYAAVQRLMDDLSPHPSSKVDGKTMFGVAVIGLFVNLLMMKILGHHHHHGGHDHHHGGHSHNGHDHSHGHSHKTHSHKAHDKAHDATHGHYTPHSHEANKLKEAYDGEEEVNMNIRAAYLHALGDFLQSIGVCIAGALIWYNPSWQIADPIATFMFSIMVLGTTVDIAKQSVHVLMEGTPDGINAEEINNGLRALPSIQTTHDLHIWSLTVGLPSLSVHLVSETPETALREAQLYLISKGIQHTTIQVEKCSKDNLCLGKPCS